MSSWSVRRVTKPSAWYAFVVGVVGVHVGVGLIVATVPEARVLGDWLWLVVPAVLVGGFGLSWWRAVRAPAARLELQGRWLTLEARGRRQRFDLARGRVSCARWAYPSQGAMGTIVEVTTPEGRLRVAFEALLPADRYDLPSSYSYELQVAERSAGLDLLVALRQATGASGRASAYRERRPPSAFVIPLCPNSARGGLWTAILAGYGGPLAAGLCVIPLTESVTLPSIALTLLGVVLGASLVALLLWRRRQGRRYQLRLVDDRVMLEDRYTQAVLAQADSTQLDADRTYYTISGRSGSWEIPSVSLSLAGFSGELTIAGGGAGRSGWIARATKAPTAKYVIGAIEWEHLIGVLGL